MSSKAWKNLERKVAKDLGTRRVLRKGESVPDVITNNGLVAIDTKNRKVMNPRKEMRSIEKYREGEIEILALIHKYPGKKKMSVFITSKDFLKILKRSLQKKNIIIELNYKDFIDKINSFQKV
jgi:hypothetical protein